MLLFSRHRGQWCGRFLYPVFPILLFTAQSACQRCAHSEACAPRHCVVRLSFWRQKHVTCQRPTMAGPERWQSRKLWSCVRWQDNGGVRPLKWPSYNGPERAPAPTTSSVTIPAGRGGRRLRPKSWCRGSRAARCCPRRMSAQPRPSGSRVRRRSCRLRHRSRAR